MLNASRGRHNGNEPPGFNIIEILIAISILSIVSAIAIPGIVGGIQRTGVDGASRRLAEDIRLAQSSAITRGVQTRLVVFDQTGLAPYPMGTNITDTAKGNLYRIELKPSPTATWPALTDTPGSNSNVLTPWNNLAQFQGVQVTTGNTLVFNTQGFIVNSVSPLSIVMQGTGGTKTVQTSAIGKATVL